MKLHHILLSSIFVTLATTGAALANGKHSADDAHHPSHKGHSEHVVQHHSGGHKHQQHKQHKQHQKKRFVRVKRGDTLSKIAHKHRVNIKKIKRINKLHGKKARHLRVGQRIRIR